MISFLEQFFSCTQLFSCRLVFLGDRALVLTPWRLMAGSWLLDSVMSILNPLSHVLPSHYPDIFVFKPGLLRVCLPPTTSPHHLLPHFTNNKRVDTPVDAFCRVSPEKKGSSCRSTFTFKGDLVWFLSLIFSTSLMWTMMWYHFHSICVLLHSVVNNTLLYMTRRRIVNFTGILFSFSQTPCSWRKRVGFATKYFPINIIG